MNQVQLTIIIVEQLFKQLHKQQTLSLIYQKKNISHAHIYSY